MSAISRAKVLAVAVAAVAVVALAAVASGTITGGSVEPRQAFSANLWVDPSGGECRRSEAKADFVVEFACKRPADAWERAEPGDVVGLRSGRYASDGTAFTGERGDASRPVVLTAAPRAHPVFVELDVADASGLRLRDVAVVADPAVSDNNDKVIDVRNAHDVELDRVRLDLHGQVRDGLGISGGVHGLTVRNSDICCNAGADGVGGKLIQIQDAGDAFGPNTGIELEGNRIHTNLQGTPEDHMECLYIAAVTQFVLARNHFYDCSLNTIEGAFGSVPQIDWTIEGNVFEAADGGAGGTVPLDLMACNERSAWVVQHNYFASGVDACPSAGVLFRGNVGISGGCRTGARYEYNVWADATCSPTDVEAPEVAGGGAFVASRAPGERGPGDYRPAADAPQIGAVLTGDCPVRDAAGRQRDAAGGCDAGPFAYHE